MHNTNWNSNMTILQRVQNGMGLIQEELTEQKEGNTGLQQ